MRGNGAQVSGRSAQPGKCTSGSVEFKVIDGGHAHQPRHFDAGAFPFSHVSGRVNVRSASRKKKILMAF